MKNKKWRVFFSSFSAETLKTKWKEKLIFLLYKFRIGGISSKFRSSVLWRGDNWTNSSTISLWKIYRMLKIISPFVFFYIYYFCSRFLFIHLKTYKFYFRCFAWMILFWNDRRVIICLLFVYLRTLNFWTPLILVYFVATVNLWLGEFFFLNVD